MEIVLELANRAVSVHSQKNRRILITLAGIPGSGKTTVATQVAAELNSRGIPSVVVGMDGFHYCRKELVERIGPERAAKYRGAPYTFDADGVLGLAKQLANERFDEISFPTFDHAVKDPIANGGTVSRSTQIVILEGLYLHLRDPIWCDIMPLADDTWYFDVDLKIATERVANRHFRSGIVDSIEKGLLQAKNNDLVNGRYIIENSRPANITLITST